MGPGVTHGFRKVGRIQGREDFLNTTKLGERIDFVSL